MQKKASDFTNFLDESKIEGVKRTLRTPVFDADGTKNHGASSCTKEGISRAGTKSGSPDSGMVFAAVTRLTRHGAGSQQRPRGFRRGGTGGQHVVHKQDAFSADGGVGAHAVGQIAATAFGAELHLCRVFIFAGQRGKDGHAPDFAEMLSQQPGLIETPLLKTAAGGRHGNERVAFASGRADMACAKGSAAARTLSNFSIRISLRGWSA